MQTFYWWTSECMRIWWIYLFMGSFLKSIFFCVLISVLPLICTLMPWWSCLTVIFIKELSILLHPNYTLHSQVDSLQPLRPCPQPIRIKAIVPCIPPWLTKLLHTCAPIIIRSHENFSSIHFAHARNQYVWNVVKMIDKCLRHFLSRFRSHLVSGKNCKFHDCGSRSAIKIRNR